MAGRPPSHNSKRIFPAVANPSPEQPDSDSREDAQNPPADLSLAERRLVARLDRLWRSESETTLSEERRSIGPYQIIRTVGHGAFGVVFQAIDPRLNRDVAVKVPRPEVLVCYEKLQRFADEAQTAARLDHPGIVPVYAAELAGPTPYIASAFCSGPDLAAWLETHPAANRSCEEVVRFLLPIVQAVAYAHSQGVVHRDIKPSNIMLTALDPAANGDRLGDYAPRLTDFGLAKLTDAPLASSRSSWILGTPTYMAPEQLLPQWGAVGEKADIFALGAMLWEFLVGEPPRADQTYSDIIAQLLSEAEALPPLPRADVPQDLRSIVHACVAKDPNERYRSVDRLVQDLEAFLAGERVSVRRSGWFDAFRRWASQPRRPQQICFFAIAQNLVMMIWMIAASLLSWTSLYHGVDPAAVSLQMVSIGLSYNLVTAFLCWLRLYGHKWATTAALVLTILAADLVPILVLTGVMDTFPDMYRDVPYFNATNHVLILLLGLSQTFLFSVSLFADYQQSRREGAGSKLAQ
ncbi:hypothetical protein C5Y93_05115 [Blastopirellula marina]|uniref:Protein kinase domain-containing protein n=1 Tax=Blastopirellula marina TaxID=124 RepID=A0A2S8GSM7_9BACT|nr:hypothetical protein C5Y93_05115 [Blastopirellula marina]